MGVGESPALCLMLDLKIRDPKNWSKMTPKPKKIRVAPKMTPPILGHPRFAVSEKAPPYV